MDMQDKDFDKVFSSKFDDFEMEPSPMVWDNIADELGSKKAKRPVMPFLSIAASIIVLCTAGVLFFKQKQTITDAVKPKVAVNVEQPATITKTPDAATDVSQQEQIAATVNNTTYKNIPSATNTGITVNSPVKEDGAVKPSDEQPLIAAIVEPKPVVQSVVPDKDIQLVPKTLDIEPQTFTEKPAVMAAANKRDEAPVVKKRGIHNLGGLINAIVAKVDKRDDKIIEFSDSDDDDAQSSVTGVNLGIIKIKKQ